VIASRASRLERPVAGPSDLRTVDPMPGRVFFAYSTPPLSAIVTPTLRPPLNTRFLCFCSFSGEPTSHSLAQSAPAPSLPIAQKPRTSRLNPYPRRLELGRNPSYLICPPPRVAKIGFLQVADSARMLLEMMVSTQFDVPIRYAFAYGSGVFEQDGCSSAKKPMDNSVFAIDHALVFHQHVPVPRTSSTLFACAWFRFRLACPGDIPRALVQKSDV